VSVGELFVAAIIPGGLLILCYITYILVQSRLDPESAPPIPIEEIKAFKEKNFLRKVFSAFLMPFLLILAVLGSIFAGIATPTEAAAVGALGASIMTFAQGRFNSAILKSVVRETTFLTSMVFLILLGATTFSFVFREMGGDRFLIDLINQSNLSGTGFLILVMIVVFIAGFFIDFIEIVFIIVPVVYPIFQEYDMNLIWIGILLAVNLQTSFLTPPFGFSLFYLKGVAPEGVTTGHIYRGIIPFVIIQLVFLGLIATFPSIVFLWETLFGN